MDERVEEQNIVDDVDMAVGEEVDDENSGEFRADLLLALPNALEADEVWATTDQVQAVPLASSEQRAAHEKRCRSKKAKGTEVST